MRPARRKTFPVRSLFPILAAVAILNLAGCGMFNANAKIGPDLRPHLGTSVSVPLGK